MKVHTRSTPVALSYVFLTFPCTTADSVGSLADSQHEQHPTTLIFGKSTNHHKIYVLPACSSARPGCLHERTALPKNDGSATICLVKSGREGRTLARSCRHGRQEQGRLVSVKSKKCVTSRPSGRWTWIAHAVLSCSTVLPGSRTKVVSHPPPRAHKTSEHHAVEIFHSRDGSWRLCCCWET